MTRGFTPINDNAASPEYAAYRPDNPVFSASSPWPGKTRFPAGDPELSEQGLDWRVPANGFSPGKNEAVGQQ